MVTNTTSDGTAAAVETGGRDCACTCPALVATLRRRSTAVQQGRMRDTGRGTYIMDEFGVVI
jgi:hypothetical protein